MGRKVVRLAGASVMACCGICLAAGSVLAANLKPVANAGEDLVVGLGAQVTLNGAGSRDEDGAIVKYRWRQLSGRRVRLKLAQTATPNFLSPASVRQKRISERLVFALTVVDDKRAKSADKIVVNAFAMPSCSLPLVLRQGVCSLPQVCPSPKILNNGVCVDPTPACDPPLLPVGGRCVQPDPVCEAPQVLQTGVCAVPAASPTLNDTGILKCSDGNQLAFDCPLPASTGQDAEFGRDVIANDGSDGRAGFSFTKIGPGGEELQADALQWSCVRDNVTGLIWEIKTADGGLRDKQGIYTNWSADFDPLGSLGSGSDASGYASAVNALGLCGAADWRLPTATELQNLVDYGVPFPGPTLDRVYFPDGVGAGYWSATPYAGSAQLAWAVYFNDGRVFDDYRQARYPVRLVRGGTP